VLLLSTIVGGAMLLFPTIGASAFGGDVGDGDGDRIFRALALTVHLLAGGLRPVRSLRLIEAIETVYFSGQRTNASFLVRLAMPLLCVRPPLAPNSLLFHVPPPPQTLRSSPTRPLPSQRLC
jgi:hypothetical protein